MVMEYYEYNPYPLEGKALLNRLLFNIMDAMRASSEACIYYDLHDKYMREKQLIKTDKRRVDFVNEAYNKAKKIKSKISKKEKLYQKLENLDTVERLINDADYNVNNFVWRVFIDDYDSYEKKEILSKALESFDSFKTALDSKVLRIYNAYNIRKQIMMDTYSFNEVLKYKMEYKMIDFYQNDFEAEPMTEDEVTQMILDYKASLESEDPFMDEYDEEYEEEISGNVYAFLMNEYYNELCSMAFRLYLVYTYFVDNDINIDNLDLKGYNILHRAIHYYNLEDEYENLKRDDDYVTDYESLPIFYKMYIYNLGMILFSSVNEEDELNKLNEEKRKKDGVVEENKKAPIKQFDTVINFDELTKKLILELKKRKKQQ